MGRDSEFVLLTGSLEQEDAAFARLAYLLAARGENDFGGSGTLVRLADLLRDDAPRGVAAGFREVWLGTCRNVVHPDLRQAVATLPWVRGDRVQLLLRDMEDDVWALWLRRGDTFVEAEHPATERVPVDLWGTVLQVLPGP